jgi:hypothetical protein
MLTPQVGLLKVPFFPGSFGIRFSKLLKAAVEDVHHLKKLGMLVHWQRSYPMMPSPMPC